MKKKIFIVLTLILSVLLVASCGKKETMSDALKFKEEYESVNDTKTSSGKDIRNLSIPEDNPFVYKTPEDIVKLMEEKETFAVYFGYNTCPWCRSVLPTLIDVAKDLDITKIYYVDIHDIRDTLEIKDGEVVTSKKGSDGYYKLLEAFANVLVDYTLTDSKGKEVKTDEKRIYAPNVISVIDGVAQKLDTGISELQTDGYMELTEEMKKETYDRFKCVLECLEDVPEKCGIGC